MRGNGLLDAMGGIDGKYLEEAYSGEHKVLSVSGEKHPALLDAVGDINEKYLSEAEIGAKKNPRVLSFNKKRIAITGVVAAAVCTLIVGGTFIAVISESLHNTSAYTAGRTSEKYSSLTALAEDIRNSPAAVSQKHSGSYQTINIFGAEKDSTAAIVGDTLCSTDEDSILLFDLTSGSDEPVSETKGKGSLLSCGGKLVSVNCSAEGEPARPEYTTTLTAFTVHNAKAAGSGGLTVSGCSEAAFEYNGLVYVFCSFVNDNSDANAKDNLPTVTAGGRQLSFDENEIVILGEPHTLGCLSLIVYDPAADSVKYKRAFYGDVASLFLGGDKIMLSTQYQDGESSTTQGTLYCFDKNDLRYRGSLSCTDIFGIKPAAEFKDLADGGVDIAIIDSADCRGDTVRMIGRKCSYRGISAGSQERTEELFSLSFDLNTGRTDYSLILPYKNTGLTVDEVTWEQERCIVILSGYDSSAAEMRSCFVFAQFGGDKPQLIQSDVKVRNVTGVDMIYGYGSLFGWYETMIPLGDGRFLRYTDTSDSLDLYDLSDSDNAVLLAEGLCPTGEDRYELDFLLCPDGKTLGIAVIKKGRDDGYRDASLVWRVFDIGKDSLTPISETPVTKDYSRYRPVSKRVYGDDVLYVCPDTNKLISTREGAA